MTSSRSTQTVATQAGTARRLDLRCGRCRSPSAIARRRYARHGRRAAGSGRRARSRRSWSPRRSARRICRTCRSASRRSNTEKLEQLNIQTSTTTSKYSAERDHLPGGQGGNGTGTSHVYMRGIASGGDANHSGSQPTVGIYLDEQPVTTIERHARHAHVRHRAHRGAGRAAGHVVRRELRGRHHPHHHQQAGPGGFKAGYDVRATRRSRRPGRSRARASSTSRSRSNAAVRLVGWDEHERATSTTSTAPTYRTFPQFGITINNGSVRKNKLQRRRHLRCARGAEDRPQRQLVDHARGDHGPADQVDGLRRLRPDVGDLKLRALLSRQRPGQLRRCGADHRGQDRQLRPDLRRRLPATRHDHHDTDYSDYSLAYDISSRAPRRSSITRASTSIRRR